MSEAGSQVDLQDSLSRLTFDSLCTVVFGFDPNCLQNKFSELREIAYKNSLCVIEEVIYAGRRNGCMLVKRKMRV